MRQSFLSVPEGASLQAISKHRSIESSYNVSTKRDCKLPVRGAHSEVSCSSALSIPLTDGVVGLTVTSPPYHNAIDYQKHLEKKWYEELLILSWLMETSVLGNISTIESNLSGKETVQAMPLKANACFLGQR